MTVRPVVGWLRLVENARPVKRAVFFFSRLKSLLVGVMMLVLYHGLKGVEFRFSLARLTAVCLFVRAVMQHFGDTELFRDAV